MLKQEDFPPREDFYNELHLEEIDEAEYQRLRDIFYATDENQERKMKNMKDFLKWYNNLVSDKHENLANKKKPMSKHKRHFAFNTMTSL